MSRKFQCKTVPSTWLQNNGRRLDCGPYMSGAIEARELLKKHRTEPLKTLTAGHDGGIYNGPQFVRNYVDDPAYGVPFLTTSTMLHSDLNSLPFISRKDAHSAKLRYLEVEEGMTLITCSGSIGRMAFARKDMAGCWSNQDIMKIVANQGKVTPGYLYAFLSSRFGVPIVVSGTYGAIIQHIEPHHIAGLPVPRLGEVEDQSNALVQQAATFRTKASELLEEVTISIKEQLGAPEVRDNYSIAQVVSSLELEKTMRMEGYFFNHRAREVDRWAKVHRNGAWPLREIADVYDVPPFKHIYVEPDYGVPFFTSGELFKLERKAEKHLSRTQTKDLDKYILERNWVLLARSGQLGGIICRPQFADSALENTATSDHVIRIVPKSKEVPPGYIYAYLSTPEVGYQLLARTACGTSIPALWPTYLNALPVVRADATFMNSIDADVKNAFEMRVKATNLEDEARALVERTIEKGGR